MRGKSLMPKANSTKSHYFQQFHILDILERVSTQPTEMFKNNINSVEKEQHAWNDKQTITTIDSLKSHQSLEVIDEEVQYRDKFTFCTQGKVSNKKEKYLALKSKHKFSSTSIQNVILYALLFNHLQLEEIQEKLPNIKFLSLQCYKLIKRFLLKYDQIAAKMKIKDFISPQSAFRIIENQALSMETRKQWLKHLVSKINKNVVIYMFNLVSYEGQANNTNFRILEDSFQRIDDFATCLGIKIIYEKQPRAQFYGLKKSPISISLKKSESDELIMLKNIKCAEQDDY